MTNELVDSKSSIFFFFEHGFCHQSNERVAESLLATGGRPDRSALTFAYKLSLPLYIVVNIILVVRRRPEKTKQNFCSRLIDDLRAAPTVGGGVARPINHPEPRQRDGPGVWSWPSKVFDAFPVRPRGRPCGAVVFDERFSTLVWEALVSNAVRRRDSWNSVKFADHLVEFYDGNLQLFL